MDWMRGKRQRGRFSGRIFPDSMLLLYFLKIFCASNEHIERETWSVAL